MQDSSAPAPENRTPQTAPTGFSFWPKVLLWIIIIVAGFLYIRSLAHTPPGAGQAEEPPSVGTSVPAAEPGSKPESRLEQGEMVEQEQPTAVTATEILVIEEALQSPPPVAASAAPETEPTEQAATAQRTEQPAQAEEQTVSTGTGVETTVQGKVPPEITVVRETAATAETYQETPPQPEAPTSGIAEEAPNQPEAPSPVISAEAGVREEAAISAIAEETPPQPEAPASAISEEAPAQPAAPTSAISEEAPVQAAAPAAAEEAPAVAGQAIPAEAEQAGPTGAAATAAAPVVSPAQQAPQEPTESAAPPPQTTAASPPAVEEPQLPPAAPGTRSQAPESPAQDARARFMAELRAMQRQYQADMAKLQPRRRALGQPANRGTPRRAYTPRPDYYPPDTYRHPWGGSGRTQQYLR